MRKTSIPFAAAALAVSLTNSSSHAVQQPAGAGPPGLELYSGERARPYRDVRWRVQAPTSRAAPWARLRQRVASLPTIRSHQRPAAVASWDEATGVPHRIVLSGLQAPGASASGAVAAAFARRLLEDHLDLLAPGARPEHFVEVVDHAAGGLRTIAFEQRHRGMPVLGGAVSFRFKADRLLLIASEAWPEVDADRPAHPVTPATAAASARAWLVADGFTGLAGGNVTGPLVLPVVRAVGKPAYRYRTVLRVVVDTAAPRARFAIYVDAASGEPVARRQLLRFAEGTLHYDAPERYPGGGRVDFPAALADVTVDGTPTTTDELGLLSFADGGPVTVEAAAVGPRVAVHNEAGAAAVTSLSLAPSGTTTWSASDDELVDAQLSAFIHVGRAKAHAAELAPTMSWLDKPLGVNVNIADRCNAFYDGTTLNFYQAGGPCENTALLADVIYHEFGHGFHHQAILVGSADTFDEALSEGLSDFFAATITDDPGMGRGFFLDEQPLRHVDPPDFEHVWPFDVGSDPHYTGLIVAGALWDLRKALIAKLGEAEGKAVTDALYYQGMLHASDIPSMYVEVLAADDDDGDLQNGTPNGCEINQAFGAHGLRAMVVEPSVPAVISAAAEQYEVGVDVHGLIASCEGQGVDTVELSWRRRNEPRELHQVTMSGGPESWQAAIPQQPPGTVVQYAITITLGDSTVIHVPENRADPMMELFVGAVTPLYCTDFEVDPELEGWTHGLESGSSGEGADDWQWDQPQGGTGSGDPDDAYSGTYVFGNDLGHGNYDGNYQPDKVNYALPPVVATGEFENVRLQYRRWLNVEDGFYDQATIYADGEPVWQNFDSQSGEPSNTHHRDRRWRFHDVDLSAAAGDGTVQVRFEIASDGGLQLGGWTLDDVCIVGFEAPPVPACGDGVVDEGEQCDDGNVASGDGCSDRCLLESEPAEVVDDRAILTPRGGCACRLAAPLRSRPGAWLGVLLLGMAAARRRGRIRG